MRLNPEQIERFERDGYLFFPAHFRPEEIKVLSDEVPALYAQRRPENVRAVPAKRRLDARVTAHPNATALRGIAGSRA